MVAHNLDKTALLLVDIQNDFCTGTLAVPGAVKILPEVNELIDIAIKHNLPIIASRDWHPENHSSFADCGGPWPAHCVADSVGAQLHSDIPADAINTIVHKGCAVAKEEYSAITGKLAGTDIGLLAHLRQLGIGNLIVCGLALDYCVYHTVIDAQKNGLHCKVVLSACREIDAVKSASCIQSMRAQGAIIYTDSAQL
jgi:nicotinamidase/pyrazinamidase